MIKELIHCRECNQVIPNYGGFEWAAAKGLPEVEWNNADLAGVKEFLHVHRSHRMEKLLIKLDTGISAKPFYEPLRVTYFLAGSGQRNFLVRRTKIALDQPAFYEIISGRLQIFNVSLQIQEDELGKQMAADRELSLWPRRKVQRFIQAFREEVARLCPEVIGEALESIEEGESSLQAFGRLKESGWERILNRCRADLNDLELDQIKRFIAENRDPPQALSLLIQRRISIISLVERESGAALEDREERAAFAEAQFTPPAEKKVEKGRA
jgi:hypothetical protein